MIRNKLLLWLTEKLPARAIDLDSKYYIERYACCKIGKFSVMLHRYLGSDGDRAVHNHPWRWCLGIPLIGGYSEERVVGFCPEQGWISKIVKIRPWRWNLVSAERYHKITHVEQGTWTLFITYDRFKSWNFASKTGDTVTLHQPYNTKELKNWKLTAQSGKEFRMARGTNI